MGALNGWVFRVTVVIKLTCGYIHFCLCDMSIRRFGWVEQKLYSFDLNIFDLVWVGNLLDVILNNIVSWSKTGIGWCVQLKWCMAYQVWCLIWASHWIVTDWWGCVHKEIGVDSAHNELSWHAEMRVEQEDVPRFDCSNFEFLIVIFITWNLYDYCCQVAI